MAAQKENKLGRRLYLVRHGEAEDKDVDPTQSLTDNGRETVQRVAKWAVSAGVHVDNICHSGKKRAAETAAIFAEFLKPPLGVRAVSGLNPVDDVKPIAKNLAQQTATVMVVGHLPFLSRLANVLVGADQDRAVIAFRNADLVGLVRSELGWRIEMIVPPEVIE